MAKPIRRLRSAPRDPLQNLTTQNGQLSAAIAAIRLASFAKVSTEQLVSELRDLGIEVKIPLAGQARPPDRLTT